MKSVAINGSIRENLGSKEAKALRSEGNVPCVVYGGEAPIHFSAPRMELRHLVFTSEFKVAEINLGDKTVKAIIQDIQFHPTTDAILHLDLIELIEGKPVTAVIPVTLSGTSRGVKNGGKLKFFLRSLKVKATPENLPDMIDLDITQLRIGQSIRVSAVNLGENVDVLNAPNAVIVSVKTSRVAVDEDEDEEEGTEEGAEGAEAPAEAAAE
jgi:large subunit ribosomal protein L25